MEGFGFVPSKKVLRIGVKSAFLKRLRGFCAFSMASFGRKPGQERDGSGMKAGCEWGGSGEERDGSGRFAEARVGVSEACAGKSLRARVERESKLRRERELHSGWAERFGKKRPQSDAESAPKAPPKSPRTVSIVTPEALEAPPR